MEINLANIPLNKDTLKYGTAIAAVLASSVGIGVWTLNHLADCKERKKLRQLVLKRQKEHKEQLDQLKSQYKLTNELKEIVELSLDALIWKLQTRELSAKKVLEAFIAKTLEVNDECNCITEFHPKAMELAEQLDGIETPKGPLHGIPFCVKDDTNVAGMDSTVGLAKSLYKPAQRSATMVQILQDLGGIPYCRTNVPQTCASYSSHNPIFGLTVNPLNKKLSPGGSSAGTGALLGAKGCLFGTGSDTGGSARCPAHFCGVSSLKASKNRISRKGSLQCVPNCIGLPPNPCIMGRRAEYVSNVFKLLTEDGLFNKYDAKAVPLPWNSGLFESTQPLRIGYLTSTKICPTIGDIPKTILKAKQLFENIGHTLIPFELTQAEEYLKLTMDLFHADLGKHFVELVKNEEISPVINGFARFCKIPAWKRNLFNWLKLKELPGTNVQMSYDLWDCTAKRRAVIEKLLEEMAELKLDLILCPVYPTPALPIDAIHNATIELGFYLVAWNFMDFPAGVTSVGVESGADLESDIALKYPGNKYFQKYVTPHLKELIGMPLGVQIVGKPYQEEVVLRAMVELERAVESNK